MLAHLREAVARLQNPLFEKTTPAILRWRAAFQESVRVVQEVRKGEVGNPTVIARADLLQQDIWNRWRAGEGIAPTSPDPLTHAITKLADVADRQLKLMTLAEPSASDDPPGADGKPRGGSLPRARGPARSTECQGRAGRLECAAVQPA